MIKYFEDGYIVQRYEKDTNPWSDGEGLWVDYKPISAYVRTLGNQEQPAGVDILVSHRLYTLESDIRFGDKIAKGDKSYRVKLVDNKKIPTSGLDFYQVDCELVV